MHNTYVISESVGVGGVTGTGHRMATDGTWKYMLSDTGEEALFNLQDDPFELVNLFNSTDNTEEINKLKTSLQEWQKMTGDKKSIPGQIKDN